MENRTVEVRDLVNTHYLRHIQWGGILLLLLAFGLLIMALFLFKPDRSGQEQNALTLVQSTIKADYAVDAERLPVPKISLDLIQEALQDRSSDSAPFVVNGLLQIPFKPIASATATGTPTQTSTTLPSSTVTLRPTITGTLPTATKTTTLTRTATLTLTPSATQTLTPTRSATATPTLTPTPSITVTPTPTRTSTQSPPTQITLKPAGFNPTATIGQLATVHPP